MIWQRSRWFGSNIAQFSAHWALSRVLTLATPCHIVIPKTEHPERVRAVCFDLSCRFLAAFSQR
jgi:hypothetical protein